MIFIHKNENNKIFHISQDIFADTPFTILDCTTRTRTQHHGLSFRYQQREDESELKINYQLAPTPNK